MELSFELEPMKNRQLVLNDYLVWFNRRGNQTWLLCAASVADSKLTQAGFPLNVEIEESFPVILNSVAEILQCSRQYHVKGSHYPIGNTGFVVYCKRGQWYLRHIRQSDTPAIAYMSRMSYAHSGFPTRGAAVKQLRQWYIDAMTKNEYCREQ